MSFLSLIPSLKWLRLGLYAALFGAGVWTGLQWNDDALADLELARVRFDRDQAREAVEQEKRGQEALADFYEAKLKTAKGKVTHETITKLVPADSDCRVPDAAVGLLNTARMPYDSAGAVASSTSGSQPGPLYTTGLIEADADLAGLYNDCRAQIKANAKWWGGR